MEHLFQDCESHLEKPLTAALSGVFCTTKGADLRGSNIGENNNVYLFEARYDTTSIFPDGFEPVSSGMYLIAPNSNLEKANLSYSRLIRKDFSFANPSYAQLADSDLSFSKFEGSNLYKTDLRYAVIIGSDLRESNIDETILENAYYDSRTLFPEGFSPEENSLIFVGPNADLRHANFSSSELSNIDLSFADLRYVSLIESDLNLTQFVGANLINADLRETNLNQSFVEDALYTEDTIFPEGLDAEARQMQLMAPEVTAVNLNMHYFDLSNLNLKGADLGGSDLSYSLMSNSDLSFVDFRDAILEGVDLSDSDLTGADLSYVNLIKANLGKVTGLEEWQLNNAKLCETLLPENIKISSNRNCDELGIEANSLEE